MTAQAARVASAQLPARLAAWSVGPTLIAIAHFLMIDAHPIARMCAFIAVLFMWMKAVVLVEQSATGRPTAPHLAAWLFLWPGMRPLTWSAKRKRAAVGGVPPTVSSSPAAIAARLRFALQHGVSYGVARIVIGGAFVAASHLAWHHTGSVWAVAPLAAIAFSLILHYGLFTLLVAGWRKAGFNVGPLFRNPLASRSLPDFWTRRWNLAYVEMCQETVLRVTRPLGRRASSLIVFLFSGLLHEVAISLPVQRGYGLPLLYFALNGAAMQVSAMFKEGGILARLWAAFWVIAPLPLLFHWPFVTQVLLPIMGIQP